MKCCPQPKDYFADYLNLPKVQQALGSDVNYTTSNSEIYFAFQQTGDFVYDNFMEDLEQILDYGVRVSLIYGDADYICNWFGGEAVSLAMNYTHSEQSVILPFVSLNVHSLIILPFHHHRFRAAGYAPMTVNGTQYGETREYGNFSFTRVYEAGHEVSSKLLLVNSGRLTSHDLCRYHITNLSQLKPCSSESLKGKQ
jgi:carboxypeptidase C (cathepsin A)